MKPTACPAPTGCGFTWFANAAAIRPAEQLRGGDDGLERGCVHGGADVRRHEVVPLRLAGAAPVGLDLGDRQQHVAVDAGRRAGLERERDQAGRCVGELRAEA